MQTPGESCCSRKLHKAQQVREQMGTQLLPLAWDPTPQPLPCLTGLWEAGSEAWNSTEQQWNPSRGQDRVKQSLVGSKCFSPSSFTLHNRKNAHSVTPMNSAQAQKPSKGVVSLNAATSASYQGFATPTLSLLWVLCTRCHAGTHNKFVFFPRHSAKRSWNQGPALIRTPLRK